MKMADRIGGFLLLAFAVYIHVGARSMEYATAGVPGPAFVPFWISLVLGIVAILILIGSWTKPLSGPLIANRTVLWRTVVFGLGMAAVVVLIPFFGMILTLALFILVAVPLLGARNWLHIATAVVLVPAFVYCLFHFILQIPLPVGPWRF